MELMMVKTQRKYCSLNKDPLNASALSSSLTRTIPRLLISWQMSSMVSRTAALVASHASLPSLHLPVEK